MFANLIAVADCTRILVIPASTFPRNPPRKSEIFIRYESSITSVFTRRKMNSVNISTRLGHIREATEKLTTKED